MYLLIITFNFYHLLGMFLCQYYQSVCNYMFVFWF